MRLAIFEATIRGGLALLFAILASAPGFAQQSNRWAILIGVDDYTELSDLKYCGADMDALKDRLIESGFPPRHVFLLHDSAKDNKYRPFKANIEKQVDLILGLVEKDDFVVVAFSGHGVHLGGSSYLCPAEARLDKPAETMVALDLVYKRLADCDAAFKLLLVDACRNDPRPGGARSAKATEPTRKFGASLERPPFGILLLTSCAPGQISMEDEELGHGVFIKFLLEGMAGKGDLDKNRRVSLLELYKYANRETKLYVARKFNVFQTPALKGDLSGDFDVVRIGGSGAPDAESVPTRPSLRQRAPQRTPTIARGLEFLAQHQHPDGHWSLDITGDIAAADEDKPMVRSDTAATALALLAFLGAGETHRDTAERSPYRQVVERGLQWLMRQQQENGDLYVTADDQSNMSARLYSHAIATLALCEAYGMTWDPALVASTQRALDFIVDTQDRERGGWRYIPGRGADTSVSAWMVSALRTGRTAGLEVPESTFERVRDWLELAQLSESKPHLYRYNPFAADTRTQRHGREVSRSMTAAGLLMRLYTGWQPTDRHVQDGARYLEDNLPVFGTGRDLDANQRDAYYWFYGGQVMTYAGGDYQLRWNHAMVPLLTESQVQSGPLAGSWDPRKPVPDRWGIYGGRIYLTALSLLCLEADSRQLRLK